MHLVTVFLLAISLAMDAMAVCICRGVSYRQAPFRQGLILGCSFGLFQAIMPILGWYAGNQFKYTIESYDHWIAFVLLLLVGGHMIWESYGNERDSDCNASVPLSLHLVLALSIATSIDALIIGISFSLIDGSIFRPVIVIGLVTFVLSFSGIYLGRHFGKILGRQVDILGGLILIGIGIRILVSHIG